MTERMRKQYTAEFKIEAVELVAKQGYTIAEAARSLGIRPTLLGRWRQEYLNDAENAFPGTGHQGSDAEELKRLREENHRLKLEKEILKKAAAFFAKESG
jgi:transposase